MELFTREQMEAYAKEQRRECYNAAVGIPVKTDVTEEQRTNYLFEQIFERQPPPLPEGIKIPEWVSVNDKLPLNGVSVLGAMDGLGVFLYTVHYDKKIAEFFPYGEAQPEYRITHWMPLPEFILNSLKK